MLELGEFDLQAALRGTSRGRGRCRESAGCGPRTGSSMARSMFRCWAAERGDVEDDDVGMQLMSKLSELVNLPEPMKKAGSGLSRLASRSPTGSSPSDDSLLFGRVLVDDAADDDAYEKGARGNARVSSIWNVLISVLRHGGHVHGTRRNDGADRMLVDHLGDRVAQARRTGQRIRSGPEA